MRKPLTNEQWRDREAFKNALCMAALVLLFAGCTMKAEVSSRPSQAASAPLVTTSAAQTSVPAGTLQVVGKDDNCVVYEIKTEVHDAIFVNCKTGTVAIRNP